jgi:hypothetical protein
MFDWPPHRRTSPHATSFSVSVRVPSVADTVDDMVAATMGIVTTHSPLGPGGPDVAVMGEPPLAGVTVTLTGPEALEPKTLVPAPRCTQVRCRGTRADQW